MRSQPSARVLPSPVSRARLPSEEPSQPSETVDCTKTVAALDSRSTWQGAVSLTPELLAALTVLDDRLALVLRRGDIRLVRSAWVLTQDPSSFRMPHRQALEAMEQSGVSPSPLLSPQEAEALLRRGQRAVGVLSQYARRGIQIRGWRSRSLVMLLLLTAARVRIPPVTRAARGSPRATPTRRASACRSSEGRSSSDRTSRPASSTLPRSTSTRRAASARPTRTRPLCAISPHTTLLAPARLLRGALARLAPLHRSAGSA